MVKRQKDGFTKGGLTPAISTSVLNLYNSARLNGPLKENSQTTWSTVDSEITERLSSISNNNGKIRILSNTVISPSSKAAIDAFVDKYTKKDESENQSSDVKHIQYDAQSYYGIRKANQKCLWK